jgi:RNA polymerase sigma-70 factor, ECF subfamily
MAQGFDIDAIVAHAKRGDSGAFRQLVIELERDVRLFVCAFEVTQGMADEVVQSTFVTAYQKLSQYRGEGPFRAWLKAIARNHLLRILREQKRLIGITETVLEQLLVESSLDDLDRIEEQEQRTLKLRECIERLPAKMRALVEERYVNDRSMGALAISLARTDIWVRVTLCRVRQSLRRCMEEMRA